VKGKLPLDRVDHPDSLEAMEIGIGRINGANLMLPHQRHEMGVMMNATPKGGVFIGKCLQGLHVILTLLQDFHKRGATETPDIIQSLSEGKAVRFENFRLGHDRKILIDDTPGEIPAVFTLLAGLKKIARLLVFAKLTVGAVDEEVGIDQGPQGNFLEMR